MPPARRGIELMADVIVFGATSAGAQLKGSVAPPDRVVCFVETDRSMVGTSFEGCPVVPPAALCSLAFDRVLIGAADAAGTLAFLLKLGVPLDKIGFPEAVAAASDARPTAVIYGSRLEAIRTLQHVERDYRVLCFCDPDASAQGKRVAGRLVIAPADLCVLRFDKVFVGVAETYKAVHDLLWYWKVPIEKMDAAPESVLFPPHAARSHGRVRAVIFGAGASGERAFTHLRTTQAIVGFVDNSPSKQGTTFCGLPVHAPAALASLEYDRIVVGSMFAAEIMEQLASLGVDASKFVLLDPAVMSAAPPAAAMRRPFWQPIVDGCRTLAEYARG
jgi:FlaA1/EpsC-like NDP-sugar epimerase